MFLPTRFCVMSRENVGKGVYQQDYVSCERVVGKRVFQQDCVSCEERRWVRIYSSNILCRVKRIGA